MPKAKVVFHADWRVEQPTALIAGCDLTVRYARERLLRPSELSGTGPHSVTVSGFYKLDDGPAVPFPLNASGEHVIKVPRKTGRLELWFCTNSLYGAGTYDSDYGRNYVFRVDQGPDVSGLYNAHAASLPSTNSRI